MRNFITRPSPTFTRGIALLCLVAVLGGCSLVRMGYTYGETLLYWWMNSYVNFDASQQPAVKAHIANLFAWHRKTQLKDYVLWLTAAQKKVRQNVTQAELANDYADLKKFTLLTIDHALPSLADIVLSLHPDQITHIEKKFVSTNDEYRKDRLRGDIRQRQNFRFKKVMEQAEYWFGDFNQDQQKVIHAASDARPLNNELWMAERQMRQRELIVLLKKVQAEKPNRDAVVSMLREYVAAVADRHRNADDQAFFDASRDGTLHVAMVIINLATPAQKEKAVNRLQGWIDSFRKLLAA